MAPTTVRIALVDNDPRALLSLTNSIEQMFDSVSVVFTTTKGETALEYRNKVSLWILDMSLEDMSGTNVCRRLRTRAGNIATPILGVTSFSLERYRTAMIVAGGQGLVDKSDDSAIKQAIQLLVQGKTLKGFESPSAARHRILNEEKRHNELTRREQEVISLTAKGMLDEEVANQMGVTKDTIRKHMQHILQKLGLHTARQAAVYWVNRHGQ